MLCVIPLSYVNHAQAQLNDKIYWKKQVI